MLMVTIPITLMAIGSKHGLHAGIPMVWGGVDSLSDGGCAENSEETPGFTAIIAVAATTLAIATISRRKSYQK